MGATGDAAVVPFANPGVLRDVNETAAAAWLLVFFTSFFNTNLFYSLIQCLLFL
jgi:hypothetical protein